MCGIVGYTGREQAYPILLEGLKRLEYRGYDSAGISVLAENVDVERKRITGKISKLAEILKKEPLYGNTAIGHTRWATHGRPSNENAHPHTDCTGRIHIVHNGIIENYLHLKNQLVDAGHFFSSQTDTEVIAHLIEEEEKSSPTFLDAVFSALNKLTGSFAVGIISSDKPGQIIAARKNSPLILGMHGNGNFIASDVPAILHHTNEVVYLEDGDVAHIRENSVNIYNLDKQPVKRTVSRIDWNPIMAEKQGYEHFMLKEIHEQKRAVQGTLYGTLKGHEVYFNQFNLDPDYLKNIKRIIIVGCGTAYHAGLTGKFMLEHYVKIPCEIDIASEFRYRDTPLDNDDLVLAISQSGETADTLAAMRLAKKKGSKTALICNVLGSSATRESDGVIYTHAGPEIGVASTKAFTTQLIALYLLTMYLSNIKKTISDGVAQTLADELMRLPHKINEILARQSENIENMARKYYKKYNFLYLGRNINYPIALEGALKLKELSYIHAEGYPAGEMKHGPIALIDEEMPVVVIATKSSVYEKILSNVEEVKARNGIVIALATEGDEIISNYAKETIYLPSTHEMLYPLLNTIPLQLLAYYIARFRGCDIDQPRNLAKSVTVE
jgi:glucosamine--fructose-6-phosphate aminotransferase (isomerizing)